MSRARDAASTTARPKTFPPRDRRNVPTSGEHPGKTNNLDSRALSPTQADQPTCRSQSDHSHFNDSTAPSGGREMAARPSPRMVSRLQPDMIAMQSSQHEGTIRSLAAARASGYAVVFCSEANAMIRKLAGLPRVRHVFWQTAQPTCRFLVEMGGLYPINMRTPYTTAQSGGAT